MRAVWASASDGYRIATAIMRELMREASPEDATHTQTRTDLEGFSKAGNVWYHRRFAVQITSSIPESRDFAHDIRPVRFGECRLNLPCALYDVDDADWTSDVRCWRWRRRARRRWWARGSPSAVLDYVGHEAAEAAGWQRAATYPGFEAPGLFPSRGTGIPRRRWLRARRHPLSFRRRADPRSGLPQSACSRNNTSRTFIRRELNTTTRTPPHSSHH